MLVILGVMAIPLVMVLLLLFVMLSSHRKIKPGKAIIRTGFGGVRVEYSSGIFVMPKLHQAEEIDIMLQSIEIDCTGYNKLITKDQMAINGKFIFHIFIAKDKDDILHVAQTLGCQRASDPKALHQLFSNDFIEALKNTAQNYTWEAIKAAPEDFKDEVLKKLGDKLHGFEIEGMNIKSLTP